VQLPWGGVLREKVCRGQARRWLDDIFGSNEGLAVFAHPAPPSREKAEKARNDRVQQWRYGEIRWRPVAGLLQVVLLRSIPLNGDVANKSRQVRATQSCTGVEIREVLCACIRTGIPYVYA